MKQNLSEKPAIFRPRRPTPPHDSSPSASDLANGAVDSSIRAPVSSANLQCVGSEPTVRRLIEGLEVAIVVLDAGVIVDANIQAPALFGRSVGAILGLHVKELVTNESLMRLAHFLEFDDAEPILVLGLCQDQRSFPLQLRAVASIIGDGHRLRITSMTRCETDD